MNVEKADYGTIIKFGTMQDFNTKLQMEGKTIDEVIDINEFHYIASNINHDGALDIARILLDRGTSLMVKEKKYGNSAFFALCQEIFKVRSVEGLRFIETCFENVQEYDTCNKAGYSVRMLINERGTDKLKQMMESRI